jgi:hypothetical protein
MKLPIKLSLYLFSYFLLTPLATAQTKHPVPAPTDFEVHAVFAETPPFIDGNLDDPIWKDIQPITNLTQVWPEDGAPATEDSEEDSQP